MNHPRRSLPWAPLWIAIAFTVAFLAVDPHPLGTGQLGRLALGFGVTFGFWILFFALAGPLYRRSRWSLLAIVPALLVLLALWATQSVHHFLYGDFIDDQRFAMALANWRVVGGEIAHFVGEARWPLAAGAAAATGVCVLLLGRVGPPWRLPRGAARRIQATALLLFAAWVALPPLRHTAGMALPTQAGLWLAAKLPASTRWSVLGRAGDERKMPRPVSWLLDRSGVRPVPPPPGGAPRPLPDVLLILLESVRADHVTPYGYARATTPNLERFAGRPDVLRFPYAISNATFSYFSMLSLTSGLDLRRDAAAFEQAPLLWDYLHARGYETAYYTFSLGYPAYGLDRFLDTPGLDVYRDLGQERIAANRRRLPAHSLRARLVRAVLGEWAFEELALVRDDDATRNAVVERLSEPRGDAPRMLVWELECTHFRYCYDESFRRFVPASPYAFSRKRIAPLVNEYDNALAYVDAQVGRVLDLLEARGLADRTIVIVASDHGEAFYENGTVFHGFGFHPEQTHVPLLIRVPEALRGRYPAEALANLERNRTRPVQLADLVPTAVALADASAAPADPAQLDGANLLAPLPERELYATNYPPWRRDPGRARPHARLEPDRVLVVAPGHGQPEERFPLRDAGLRADAALAGPEP